MMEKEKKEEEGASSGKSASKHDWQKHAFFEKKKKKELQTVGIVIKKLYIWDYATLNPLLIHQHIFYGFLVKWGHFFLKFQPFALVFGI